MRRVFQVSAVGVLLVSAVACGSEGPPERSVAAACDVVEKSSGTQFVDDAERAVAVGDWDSYEDAVKDAVKFYRDFEARAPEEVRPAAEQMRKLQEEVQEIAQKHDYKMDNEEAAGDLMSIDSSGGVFGMLEMIDWIQINCS